MALLASTRRGYCCWQHLRLMPQCGEGVVASNENDALVARWNLRAGSPCVNMHKAQQGRILQDFCWVVWATHSGNSFASAWIEVLHMSSLCHFHSSPHYTWVTFWSAALHYKMQSLNCRTCLSCTTLQSLDQRHRSLWNVTIYDEWQTTHPILRHKTIELGLVFCAITFLSLSPSPVISDQTRLCQQKLEKGNSEAPRRRCHRSVKGTMLRFCMVRICVLFSCSFLI